jgi:hypothetical protein
MGVGDVPGTGKLQLLFEAKPWNPAGREGFFGIKGGA